MNKIIMGSSHNPWHNLALEELLFNQQKEEQDHSMTLYLWQNQNTVVIGKYQNAWKECRVELLESEGGRLARRSSGGGAVFHDLGNLNFTFLTRRDMYDVPRQLSVIQQAVRSFGVETEFTGRNDLVLKPGGEKYSGNAFRMTKEVGMHHGTILIHVNMDQLSRYLAPSKEKLASKGVESVRARVTNLSNYNPSINIPTMQEALVTAFTMEYGKAQIFVEEEFHGEELDHLEEKYSSWDWRLGKSPEFDLTLENRFGWGEISLQLSFAGGLVAEAGVYSDAMDEEFIGRIVPAVRGCPMNASALAERIRGLNHPQGDELAQWLSEKEF